MRLLIGSRALKHFGTQYLSSSSRSWDWDWIGKYTDFEEFKNILRTRRIMPISAKSVALMSKNEIHEFEIAWKGSITFELFNIIEHNVHLVDCTDNHMIASPNLVYTLKMSHRYLKNSPHFLKTMLDIKHLREMGCSIPACLRGWYKKRQDETYWYAHPNLNVTKDEFFKDDMVPYKYDHDTIHLSVKHLDRPVYEFFKDDKAEVKCSRDLFFSLPENIRLLSVLEEAYVLALERSQIPAPNRITPKQSFLIALEKVCSSISSGWWREYAWENYFKILNMYSDDYVKRFRVGVESGLVKEL